MLKTLFLFVAALVLLSIFSSPVRAAEITINWRFVIDYGRVDDLKFMPGQEQFILSSGQVQKFTEIRSCDDGRILQSYPFGGYQLEFTPDSSRIIFASGPYEKNGYLQIRKLDDMSLLNETILTTSENFPYSFYGDIAVDPIRPYIYAVWMEYNGNSYQAIFKTKILIYDLNTLELIGELSKSGDPISEHEDMAISKDGKYLAAMNIGASYLIVWDLDTRSKVIEKQIGIWKGGNDISEPADIKFSELNTDKIYFTGKFYQTGNAETLEGLCIFSISENRIIDTTFAIKPNNFGWNPEICLFENETKVIGSSSGNLKVLDLFNKKIEFEKIVTGVNQMGISNTVYKISDKYFIGGGGNFINKFQYQPNTSVPSDNNIEVIYPNPTNGLVNIPINCEPMVTYKIFDINGILLKSNVVYETTTQNLLTIDCSDLLRGVYTIQIICDKTVSLYQIVRGE